jgi:hypothetical protein
MMLCYFNRAGKQRLALLKFGIGDPGALARSLPGCRRDASVARGLLASDEGGGKFLSSVCDAQPRIAGSPVQRKLIEPY